MRQLLIALTVIFLSSCATPPLTSENASELPEWAYSPAAGCDEASELCASGEGKNSSEADAQARAALAAIFETRIEATVTSSVSVRERSTIERSALELASSSVKSEVSQVLEATSIKSRHRHGKMAYALAALDRSIVQEKLFRLIEDTDSELNALWDKHQRTSLPRMLELYFKREQLNDRYSIVSGERMLAKVKGTELITWSQQRPKQAQLAFRGIAPEWIQGKLQSELSKAGFQFAKNAATELHLTFVEKQEFLKVKGFEKWTFNVKLDHKENGQTRGTWASSYTSTGRDQQDAVLKLRTKIEEEMTHNLGQLNLD